MDPQDIIRILGMQPHPEGGWYKETFRDPAGGRCGFPGAVDGGVGHGVSTAAP